MKDLKKSYGIEGDLKLILTNFEPLSMQVIFLQVKIFLLCLSPNRIVQPADFSFGNFGLYAFVLH